MMQWRFERYREAYLEMAQRTKYRPGAPSDGCGHIMMSAEEFDDPNILEREARKYAKAFLKQDDDMEYPIGCPNGAVNKAFFYVIEARALLEDIACAVLACRARLDDGGRRRSAASPDFSNRLGVCKGNAAATR
jgi:hypothetical protein